MEKLRPWDASSYFICLQSISTYSRAGGTLKTSSISHPYKYADHSVDVQYMFIKDIYSYKIL